MARKSTALAGKGAWGAGVLFGAAASLAGCSLPSQVAGFHSPAIDPASPVYQDVMAATRHPGPYPKFSDIPQIPGDLRPASAWAVAVADIHQDKAQLDGAVAALPPVQTDTEAFAASSRGEAKPPALDLPAPDAAQQTQAYAQSLRARATPPPKRRAHKR